MEDVYVLGLTTSRDGTAAEDLLIRMKVANLTDYRANYCVKVGLPWTPEIARDGEITISKSRLKNNLRIILEWNLTRVMTTKAEPAIAHGTASFEYGRNRPSLLVKGFKKYRINEAFDGTMLQVDMMIRLL
jgi:hypothetical protein